MKIGIVAATVAFSAVCGCSALESLRTGITTNVPGARLSDATYTSPGGEYTLQVPQLTKPGMRIEERQTDPTTRVVAFGDDFGRFYGIEMCDASTPPRTVEEVAATLALDAVVREKRIITTSRGSELRGVLVMREGSPLVSQTTRNGVTTERKLDMIQARSLFITKQHVFTAIASRTRLDDRQTDDTLIALVKSDLDVFLAGLVVQ